jgi:YD repeat-containing protein
VIEHTGRIVDYSYDNTYKLLEERINDPFSGNRVIGYTYDAVGNRQTKTDNGQLTQYAYDANDRLLTENAAIYSYDNNGNTIKKQSPLENLTYSYDYQNRMTASVLINNAGVTNLACKYDPFGIRVEKTTNGQMVKYLMDPKRLYVCYAPKFKIYSLILQFLF